MFLPFVSLAQTIHFDDENIVYKGAVATPGLQDGALMSRLQEAVAAVHDEKGTGADITSLHNKIVVVGEMKLNSPFRIIRKVHYTLQLSPAENGYVYHIDSVSVSEKRRGGKTETKNAEALLEGIEDTGNVAIETEKLLNEIDMRFQKLLAVLAQRVKATRN